MAQLVYSLVPSRCVNCQAVNCQVVTFAVGEVCEGQCLASHQHILCNTDFASWLPPFVRGLVVPTCLGHVQVGPAQQCMTTIGGLIWQSVE